MPAETVERTRRSTPEERFAAQWEPEPNTGCWLWTGATVRGYGRFSVGRRQRQATHVSLEMVGGTVPAGMVVCHKCDTPWCVNPDHLFLGTPKDNVHDMMRKGRRMGGFGERHGRARLTEDAVRAIRASSDIPRVLAKRFGVGKTTVDQVKRGRSWRHVI